MFFKARFLLKEGCMRNPNRIRPFLEEVERLWNKVPDWRFGQLICNIPYSRDPFFLEEDEFLEEMKKLFKEDK